MTLIRKVIPALLVLAVCLYVLFFSLGNHQTVVDIDFVFFTLKQVSLELAVLASFVIGSLLGLLAASGLLYRAHRKYRRLLKNTRQTL